MARRIEEGGTCCTPAPVPPLSCVYKGISSLTNRTSQQNLGLQTGTYLLPQEKGRRVCVKADKKVRNLISAVFWLFVGDGPVPTLPTLSVSGSFFCATIAQGPPPRERGAHSPPLLADAPAASSVSSASGNGHLLDQTINGLSFYSSGCFFSRLPNFRSSTSGLSAPA
ncbi:hypothetical protein CDAR_35781 [Caerostris darwini]|uniref:Uncharacterized protein n=1 Tax=Caerostris darwini TaxID=1538125 RepID=A0AAV4VC50_9ARAC|nr:hypothetical protein CDAR_35781 [Caerostris darwini]